MVKARPDMLLVFWTTARQDRIACLKGQEQLGKVQEVVLQMLGVGDGECLVNPVKIKLAHSHCKFVDAQAN